MEVRRPDQEQKDQKITLPIHNNDMNTESFPSGTSATAGLFLEIDLTIKTATLQRRLWDYAEIVYSPLG
ncbi:hypothetical protein N7474_007779 [Penicillium riverlandense]|uniref:uncharacterized protein n=1 Tax=Penicillium riverlandense TaxID=1903569 RepID=UPI002547473C|nr:uncharacterized protein N7474_007779 [Penicillium riverlandense]KAJ5811478.1 hypothetical protein N7474_007779 [Penicillium riverlandense]